MYKLLFFIIGLPTCWLVAEGILLLPSVFTANLIDSLIAFSPRYQDLIIICVFNLSELLISFVVVFIITSFLVKLFRVMFIDSKYYYLLGNISSYLFILSFALFFIEYDKEGIAIFISKILFHLVGIFLAWFIVIRVAVKNLTRN